MHSPRWRSPGALLGLAVALAAWLLGQAGGLDPLDGRAYDLFLRLKNTWSAPASAVLLVECPPPGRQSQDAYARALDTLAGLGAAQVVFTFLPEEAPPDFYRRAAADPAVLFGRPLLTDPFDPALARLADLPPGAAALALRWGVVHAP